jgi:glutathione synthase/RimK-type ligase-like ATP-grasp enzyme
MKIYPYKQGSKSAAALAAALNVKQLKHEGKPIKVKGVLINWGASVIVPRVVLDGGVQVLNVPGAIAKASNKLASFKALTEAKVSVPEWTESKDVAKAAIEAGFAVVCRTKLNGHSGDGIVIAETLDQLVDAPLYTNYIKKKEEYRIHVFQGEAFFVQRKARKMEVPDEQVNWKVRNLAGGFIFANKDVEVADDARVQSIAAVGALSLDFGAVDVILGSDGKFYVLEINTACGLEGTTLEKYVQQFQKFQ